MLTSGELKEIVERNLIQSIVFIILQYMIKTWCCKIQLNEYFIFLNTVLLFSLLTIWIQQRLEELRTRHGTKRYTSTWWREKKEKLWTVKAIKNNKIFLEHYLLCLVFMCIKEDILTFLAPKENRNKTQKRRQVSLILHVCSYARSVFYGNTGFNFSVLRHHLWILWWLDYMLDNN